MLTPARLVVVLLVIAFAVSALFLWWIDVGRVRRASRLFARGVPLVDLATTAAFARSHVPGAINIPLADLERRSRELDAHLPLIVCGNGILHAMRGARLLANLGFGDVLAVGRAMLVSAALKGVEEIAVDELPPAKRAPLEVAPAAFVVVSAWRSRREAEDAIDELRSGHIPSDRLSIFVEDAPGLERASDERLARERTRFWRTRGALYGSFWGLLMGGAAAAGAFFIFPTMGPLAFVGPLGGWLVGALEGAALGSALATLRAMTEGADARPSVRERRFLVLVEPSVGARSLGSPRVDHRPSPTPARAA